MASSQAIRPLLRGFQAIHNVNHSILTSHISHLANPRSDPERVFSPLSLEPEILAELRANIARRLTPKPVKVRADIEVKCFSYAGIEAIRKALQAGEAKSTEEVPIKVRLVAPPLYVMTTTSTDKVMAMQLMEKAVEAIGEKIGEERGELVIKMKVKRSFGCPRKVGDAYRDYSRRLSPRPMTQSSKR